MSSDAAYVLMILLGLLVLIISIGAHNEANKEIERRKAAGEAVSADDAMPSIEVTWKFLPPQMRAPYHWFMGCAFVLLFV